MTDSTSTPDAETTAFGNRNESPKWTLKDALGRWVLSPAMMCARRHSCVPANLKTEGGV